MSATGRGAVRNPRDFYATPWEAFGPILGLLPTDVAFWEPACGDGRLVHWLRQSGRVADGADLEPQVAGFRASNFLTDPLSLEGSWFIITNPPFSLAFEFAQRAVAAAPEVMLLVRINFLGSKKRADWFRKNPPAAMFVITPRPSFTGGGTDACEYAWIYWGRRFSGIHFPTVPNGSQP